VGSIAKATVSPSLPAGQRRQGGLFHREDTIVKNAAAQITESQKLSAKVGQVFQKRLELTQQRFNETVRRAGEEQLAGLVGTHASPWEIWTDWLQYSTDFVQRSVLFLDVLRQRGNNFVEHEKAGKPPVLHFDYETVADARTFEQPVNYALVRIVPPAGVTTFTRGESTAFVPRVTWRRTLGRSCGAHVNRLKNLVVSCISSPTISAALSVRRNS